MFPLVSNQPIRQHETPEHPSLSLVIPAYNEAGRVAQTLQAAVDFLDSRPYRSEILLVDDGSSDGTRLAAEAFAAAHEGVRVISIPHGGKAVAVQAGVFAARGDEIAFSDADLATPLAYLDLFREEIAHGADLVIGSREGAGARRIGEPGHRHLMGRGFNLLVQGLLVPGISDTQCGFKMFRREAALAIFGASRLYAPDQVVSGPRVTAFDVEVLVIARRLGYRIAVVPVVWTYGEQSKVSPARDTLNNLRDVLLVKWHDLRGAYRDPQTGQDLSARR